ncbi:RNA-directed DNA polymerase, eukaryota [Tanacetum coccineum]
MHGSSISPSPALVLDDTCLVERDLSKHAMGKVKDFTSIPNLYTILKDEGFDRCQIDISWGYMDAGIDFVSEERIVWVDIEGIPLSAWSRETFDRIGKKWGETLDLEDNADTSFGRKRLCVKTKHPVSILETFKIVVKGRVFMVRAKELFTWNPTFLGHKEREYSSDEESVHASKNNEFSHHPNEEEFGGHFDSDDDGVPETVFGSNYSPHKHDNGDKENTHSEDPFGLYNLLESKKRGVNRESSPSLSHPPGFTPEDSEKRDEGVTDIGDNNNNVIKEAPVVFSAKVMNTFKTFLWRLIHDLWVELLIQNGGSFLGVMEDIIRVGRWNGESIVMGDFNEVRSSDERRGSCFNPYSARYFDRFISNSGLVDDTLEGYAFLCPILLREVHLDFGPTPFRFYHSWFDLVGFDDMIKLSWQSFSYSDVNGMIRFKKKLQDLKVIIRHWVKAKRLELSGSKIDITTELGRIYKVMDSGMVDDAIVLRRLELKSNLLKITEMEAKDRIQKSKVKWAVEGDENSKFFHGIINKRRSQLAIRGVFVDGIWRSDPDMIKNAFFDHFEARFKEPAAHRFKLNFQFHKKLLKSQADDLEIGCNSSFVGLIPKVIDAKFVNDFRPISLIGCVYKVVTKVLAIRLVSVIGGLVSDTQSAFVAGRQILDGPFILDEILHWCKRKKNQAMFFKVDFAKAYDSAASSIGCSILNNQFRYLGVMVGECSSRLKAWDDIILKLRSRLSKWKVKTLSIGGRLTLLKSVLGASPIYSMSIFKVPRGVLKAMEAIPSKENGGLGVSSFFALNRALLLKWVWRFVSQDGSLWCQVIRALYGSSVGSHPTHFSSNWCSIMRDLHKLKEKGFDFWSHCKKRIGNGTDTSFWSDCWIGDMPLRAKFPRLFALELDKEASVAIKLNSPVDISFRRNVRGGLEQQQMVVLNSMLEPVSLSNSCDRWFCDLTSDGDFRVKEVRNFIDDLFLPSQDAPTRWVKFIPIKVMFRLASPTDLFAT